MKRLKKISLISLLALSGLYLASCGLFGSNQLYPVMKDKKWGYINSQGKMIIEPRFLAAQNFSDNSAAVFYSETGDTNTFFNNGHFGFIDEAGKFVIEPKFKNVGGIAGALDDNFVSFSENLQFYRETDGEKSQIVFFDKSGKTVFELPGDVEPIGGFSDGLLLTRKDRHEYLTKYDYVYYDASGKAVITVPKNYEYAEPFHDDLALIAASSDGKYAEFIDKTGKPGFDKKFDKAQSFSEGLAWVSADGLEYGIIDTKGNPIGERKFPETRPFHDGLAIVGRLGIYGYIDKSGDWAFEPHFKTMPGDFSEGLAVVFEDKKFQIIDKSGKTVTALDSSIGAEAVTDTRIRGFKGGIARILFLFADQSIRLVYFNKKGEIIWNEKTNFK